MKIYHYFKNLGEENKKIQRLYQIVFWSSIAIIATLAFLKGSDLPPMPHVGDKFKHILAFIYLTFAADLAHPHFCIKFRVTILILFGAFIEVVQLYLPWRSFELLDFTVDIVAVLVITLILSMRSKKECTSTETPE